MNAEDAKAVEAFFKQGGRVVKLEDMVTVTETEVLHYLAGRGIDARHVGRVFVSRPFLCQGERVTMNMLLALANRLRAEQQLEPFALRQVLRVSFNKSHSAN